MYAYIGLHKYIRTCRCVFLCSSNHCSIKIRKKYFKSLMIVILTSKKNCDLKGPPFKTNGSVCSHSQFEKLPPA